MQWLKIFTCILAFADVISSNSSHSRQARVLSFINNYQWSTESTTIFVVSAGQCSQKCLYLAKRCIGANFGSDLENGKHQCQLVHGIGENDQMQPRSGWTHFKLNAIEEELAAVGAKDDGAVAPRKTSCKRIKESDPQSLNGVYFLEHSQGGFNAYCDMTNGGFTLVARFSNRDSKGWMQTSGVHWYSTEQYGEVNSTNNNTDMVSPAFSMVNGNDIKVTRSDDATHTALLHAEDCLEGKTMRGKMTSFGDFRNGIYWSSFSRCQGNCTASFSGQYATTSGFKHATSSCTGADNILDGNNIGFWCRYGSGDGAVIMIGGGGQTCDRADHGIGVTEEDNPKFGGTVGCRDFGDTAAAGSTAYSLNLWIK